MLDGFAIENLKNESKSSLILLITFLLSERDKYKVNGDLPEIAELESEVKKVEQPKVLDVKELMEYTKLGRCKATELGEEIGAKIKYDGIRRNLYDREVVDQYLAGLLPGGRQINAGKN